LAVEKRMRAKSMRLTRMATRLGVAAGVVLLLANGGAAGPVSGSLSVILGGLPPISVTGSGTGTSSASGVTLSASVFSANSTFPGTAFITEVQLTALNGAGAFTGATLHGPMAVRGNARLRNGGVTAFTIPLTLSGTRGVGLGGAPIQVGAGTTALTLSAGTWSTGLVQVTGVGTPGSLRTVSLAGSDARTAQGAGTLTLVTPMRISTPTLGSFAGFGVLVLTFVPEPSALALLLAASACALLGAHRARRN
jgi:hypothetical protein